VGATVYRTDLEGTIRVTSDGNTYQVSYGPETTATPTSTTLTMPGTNVQCNQVGAAQICASVSNGSPTRNSNVTVYGRLLVNGVGQGSQGMTATWHYKSSTPTCTATTGADGQASCSRSIESATVGYQVNVNVQIGEYSAQTRFTPQ
jgi:hypothetical protein